MEFGDDLTVIFGSNGSGKSGYARVIGSAAFTRGDKQILRNVITAQPSDEPLSADLEIKTEYGKIIPIHYIVGDACPILCSFYVFDSTSVKNHLTKENPMKLFPSGLGVLTSLSTLTDQIRKALEERCASKDCVKNVFDSLFVGDLKVKTLIKSLGHATDLKVLEQLATISEKERERATQLELQIAEIHSQRIQETISNLNQEIQDLENLRKSIVKLEQWMNSTEFQQVNHLLEDYKLGEISDHSSSRARANDFRLSRMKCTPLGPIHKGSL